MGAAPVPVSGTLWGLPDALSATPTEPDRVPAAAGVKVTLMVQLAPGARELPQVLVSAKSPVIVIPEIASGAFPVFDSVALWAALVVPGAWLPKARLVGENVATGAAPVPVSDTPCGLPEALSATVSEPDRAPMAVGVKVTLTVQLAPEARELPQVFVSAKSPVVEIPEIVSGAFPVFESVALWMGLVVPRA